MSAVIIPFRHPEKADARRDRIILSCPRAAMRCAGDDMTALWLKKARQASEFPPARLTAKPVRAVVNFIEKRPISLSQWLWVGFALNLAIALT